VKSENNGKLADSGKEKREERSLSRKEKGA